MSDHGEAEEIPKGALVMIGVLVAAALMLTAAVSLGFLERNAVPSESRMAAGTQVVTERNLYFHDEPDGAVLIEDAASGTAVARIDAGTGGFIRSTLRSLVYGRRAKGIGSETPFALTEWNDGGLSLSDPATGKSVELHSFGPDNRAAFAALLEPQESTL